MPWSNKARTMGSASGTDRRGVREVEALRARPLLRW